MKKILFVSHDSSFTGAPIVFMHLIKEIKAKNEFEIHILALKSGPLDSAFMDLGHLVETKKEGMLNRLTKKSNDILTVKDRLETFALASNYDLIYCNSVATSGWVGHLKNKFSCPVILHIHELEIAIEQFCGSELFRKTIPLVNHFVAVSLAVRDNLHQSFAIPETNISLVYESIPVSQIVESGNTDLKLQKWKTDGNFIVGGSGTTDWRKGIDLFLYTASLILQTESKVKFLWVGGNPKSIEFKRIVYEIKKLGLENSVHVTGETSSPNQYFQLFDLFFLSSREDPFPLVCLESGLWGNPVICFEGAGGIPELVDFDKKCLIPFASISMAAERIKWFIDNPKERIQMGVELKKKITNDFNSSKMGEKVHKIINEVLTKSNSGK